MRKQMRGAVLILIAAVTLALVCGVACAEEKGSPFKELVLKIMGYGKKTVDAGKRTVEKEVNAVGKGIKKGGDVVVEEAKDVGKLATGDMSKAKDILVKPVKGTTDMVGETAYEAIKAPADATKEAMQEEK